MINLNTLAKIITEREDGPRQIDIAQTKQILRIALEELAQFPASEIHALLEATLHKAEARADAENRRSLGEDVILSIREVGNDGEPVAEEKPKKGGRR
jgi:hypothetical protein